MSKHYIKEFLLIIATIFGTATLGAAVIIGSPGGIALISTLLLLNTAALLHHFKQ